jgi:hypothetical protein
MILALRRPAMTVGTGTPTRDEALAPSAPEGTGAPEWAPAPAWFGWVAVALAAWLVSGAHLDAWAHRHLAFETFFTSWHAVLYSGWLANTVFFAAMALRGRRQGRPWRRVLPPGYGLTLAACVVFGIGGALDMAWHLAFGIERDFSADMSPTHLLLMAMAALIVAGPLRAGLRGGSPRAGLQAVLSAAFLLSMLTFWGQFNHPLVDQWVAFPRARVPAYIGEEMGVQGVVLHAALLSGLVLVLVSRLRLPVGSLTIILGVNAVYVTIIEDLSSMVLVALLAGAVGDLLLVLLRPSVRRVAQLRLFAFLLPAELYLLYFATVLASASSVWPIHVWTGSVVLAGLSGLLLSLLVVPGATRAPAGT